MWNLNEFDIIKSLNCREAVGLLSSSYCILKRAQGTTGLLGFTKLQEIYHLGKKKDGFLTAGRCMKKNWSQLMLDLFINSTLKLTVRP